MCRRVYLLCWTRRYGEVGCQRKLLGTSLYIKRSHDNFPRSRTRFSALDAGHFNVIYMVFLPLGYRNTGGIDLVVGILDRLAYGVPIFFAENRRTIHVPGKPNGTRW